MGRIVQTKLPKLIIENSNIERIKPMSQFEIKEGVAIIPDGTTDIYDDSFSGCTSLESIIIPESVKAIGFGAFLDCTSLKSIIIPESVNNIGIGAFDGCTSLATINVFASSADNYK